MKIKKNLVAATAAVLAAGMALAGCGSSNGGSGDVQKTADGKVKITMWHGFSEADGKTLESIVDDFNKSQDKYEIDAQLQPWSTIGETMVTKVTTGDGPDFVTTGADNGQGWSIDGTFQCVSDFYADKNNGTGDYLDNVVKQITFNIDGEEEKCAVPMGYAPTSVWYNTDMWKAAGLTDKDISDHLGPAPRGRQEAHQVRRFAVRPRDGRLRLGRLHEGQRHRPVHHRRQGLHQLQGEQGLPAEDA